MAERLVIATWMWGAKYSRNYVQKLQASIKRNYSGTFQFAVFRPDPEDEHLCKIPGCFARLRMFDPAWQDKYGIERIVCFDLDLIITGSLDKILDRTEDFVIFQGANSSNPCPYNGSVMSIRRGAHPEVWKEFTLERAERVPYHSFPDDQGWIAHVVPGAAGWICGPQSGVYAFRKPHWPAGDALPLDARVVAFPGSADPKAYAYMDWVRKHWTV